MAVIDGIQVALPRDGVVEIVLSRRSGGVWLDQPQRKVLMAALSDGATQGRVILVRAADRSFSAFGDLWPDLPPGDLALSPGLPDLCGAIEGSPVPVVFFLQGPVAGLAAELAVAAQARMATPAARILFTSGRLGLVSGAGTTQRLPRLIGVDAALQLLDDGARPMPAPEALVAGLVDHIVEGEAEALTAARDWALTTCGGLRRAPAVPDARAYLRAVAAARAKAVPDSLTADLVHCIEAALLLPPEQALAYEAAIAQQRAALPETAARLHLARAERSAQKTPDALRQARVDPVARPLLVRASPGLSGLVLTALSRGFAVTVAEADRDRLVPMLKAVAARQEAAVQAGTLSEVQRDADWARLRPVADGSAVAQADLVIVAPDAVAPSLPERVPCLLTGRGDLPKGAFRLVLSGRVAELGLPPACPVQPAAQALAFLRRLGFTVVLTGVQSPLGISGRLAGVGGAAMRSLLAMGVDRDAILAGLQSFGLTAPNLPQTDPPPTRRDMPEAEIVDRWLAALANEGARLLASGLALSALDVDLVAVQGLGLPARMGGPLHHADQRGLLILRRDLRQWAADGDVWKPVPALDALVSVGRGFLGRISPG